MINRPLYVDKMMGYTIHTFCKSVNGGSSLWKIHSF